jgi:hypothetical protein
MPVRNGERYLDAALESLSAQSFSDLEIIAVDSCSTDGTAELLAQWSARDSRLRAVRLERVQLAETLNRAAELARAPLLARLDSDDLACPNRLEIQEAAMQARPRLGLLGSAAELIDEKGRSFGEILSPLSHVEIVERQQTSCSLVPSSTIMRAEIFWRAGGYRKGLNISEDFDLWMRMTELAEAANLPEKLIRYRVHKGSVTARQPVRMALASLCVSAAAEARRAGAPEPFATGGPSLRIALPLLGMTRAEAHRVVRWRSAGNHLRRTLLNLPLPHVLRHVVARLGSRSGGALYRRWLRSALRPRGPGPSGRGASRPPRRPEPILAER